MDSQKQTTGLTSVRTYAKDLEKKRASVSPLKKSVPEPTVVPTISKERLEERTYRPPSWTAKKTPLPTPHVAEKATEEAVPKLTPLSTPKNATEPAIVVENEDAASATIIRDTKKSRFKLFPAIIASVKKWAADQKRQQEVKKIPKYTVPETSRRKGVIQKATSQTGKLMSFDAASIQDRIRERKERTQPKVPLTVWTANTEPGFPLLEAPEPAIQNVKVEPRKSVKTIVVPQTPKPVAAPIPPKPLPKEVPVERKIEVPPTPTPSIPPIEPEPVIASPSVVAIEYQDTESLEPEYSQAEVPQEEVTPEEVTKKPKTIREWLFTTDTNTISVGVTVLFFVLIGTIGYYWLNATGSNLTVTTAPNHPSLINAPLQLVYVPGQDPVTVTDGIISNGNQSIYDVLQLALVTEPTGTTLVPPQSVLRQIGINLPASFTSALNYIYFGSSRKTEPFIILASSDIATAQGGMLAWENSMYGELSMFFAQENLSRDELPGAKFKDVTINGQDIRVLTTEDNQELLTYGSVNRKVIIITQTSAHFKELAALVP